MHEAMQDVWRHLADDPSERLLLGRRRPRVHPVLRGPEPPEGGDSGRAQADGCHG
jgi:hypothetical protein